MLSPISLDQKRLSIVVDPYDPPSPISPIFDLLTPSPYSPSPYSPDPATPTSPPPRLMQQAFVSQSITNAHTLPTAHTHKTRPKSYGGALTPATLELILDFESRIAELESRHTRISVELEETRDALNSERAIRRSSNRFSTLSHARFSSISSSSGHGSDEPESEQNDADYERRLRDELQDSLKKIRAQNAMISRSLRQKEETCASLTTALEEERTARRVAADEVARLNTLNFTLLEHNKLLVGRDASLQEDIASLITKSQADEWMRSVLETELRRRAPLAEECATEVSPALPEAARPNVGITLEHQGTLRAELVSTRDELHIAQVRLFNTEKQCTTLTQRVAALQKELVMCLDSSSQALETERELRADVETRARVLAEENAGLKTRLTSLEEAFPNGHAPDAWIKRSPSFGKDGEAKRRPVSGRLQKKTDSNLKIDTVDRLLDRHRHVLTSKKLREHRKRRLSIAKLPKRDSMLTPTPTFSMSFDKVRPPYTPMSPESTCSTKVASPGPSPTPMSKRNKRMSVILAATVSKKDSRPTWSALKTNSSLFVDVGSRIDEPMVQLKISTTTTGALLKPAPESRSRPNDLRTYMMRRASAIFDDLAHSYGSVETVHESADELLV
ncbi:hypothetical protein B0H16DRAFT_1508519 [Mycena metata]|uniref:Uncharacterized protein n=1 Tax=Mycena metata TaxID=1033252 RepID=A0AAD7K0Y3_9AGAR|nr:hypothetical protein B0H16DRAFT_1508519 [Mycena metata]